MRRPLIGLAVRAVGLGLDVAFLAAVLTAFGALGLYLSTTVVFALRSIEAGIAVAVRRGIVAAAHERESSVATAAARERLAAIVRNVAATAGRAVPDVVVTETIGGDRYNAAAARETAGGTIVVTTGALHELNDSELGAVVGHELAHLWQPHRPWTAPLAALAAVAGIAVYQRLLVEALWGPSLRPAWRVASLPLAVAAVVLVPYATRLVARALARHEEYRADRVAVELGADPAELAVGVYRLQTAAVRAWDREHGEKARPAELRLSGRGHFTTGQRRLVLESLCHPHSNLLRTLLVALAAGGDHPALFRRARRLLHALDHPVLLPAPFGPRRHEAAGATR